MENTGFTFDLPKGNSSIIKVIGVGGGGNNALKHMYEKGIHGVDFVICNTDAQTLDNNPVNNKVQLGIATTEGLGAGADPMVGEKAAIESIDEIKNALGANTKMVFITAGMGGGTGTGAAPVVAKVAKEMGILTVGIVTVPFAFEGRRRLQQAEDGLEKLRENVDSLIVINNDKLREQFPNLGFKQGFSKADEVLTNAAKGMAEVITAPFQINIDFRDAKSVLQNSGTALMSTGVASGENRAKEAVRKALDSPLLNDNKITGAKDVLLLILSGSDEANEATMDEIGLINDHVQEEAGGNNSANIIFGVGTDDELGDAIKVLVIATGFAKEKPTQVIPNEVIRVPLHENRESPFRLHEDTQTASQQHSRNVFRLDDDDDDSTFGSTSFRPDNQSQQQGVAAQKEDHQVMVQDFEPMSDFGNSYALPKEDPFSLNSRQEIQAESFSFETESQPEPRQTPPSEEEKPVEFHFRLTEKEDFSSFQAPAEVEKPVAQPEEKPVEAETKIEFPAPKVPEQPVAEVPKIETPAASKEEFTFIQKSGNAGMVQERRNKLAEYNSRYQVTDPEAEFERTPAFRRKNIKLEGMDGSHSGQQINSYLGENDRGDAEVRKNRFLNRDVD